MKKVFAVLTIAGLVAFTSCKKAEEATSTVDSIATEATTTIDSAAAAATTTIDSAVAKVDSAAAAVKEEVKH